MALYRYNSTNNKLIPLTSEGSVGIPVGTIIALYGDNSGNSNFLLADGRDTTGTDEELRTHYPALYTYLGNSNVLPDLRECVLVGAGQNDTDTIADHDVYTVGEFKDDQLQSHVHRYDKIDGGSSSNGGTWNKALRGASTSNNTGRTGTTTHGKQKGVNYYIKATSAGPEVDYDVFATKGYIRDQNKLSEYESFSLVRTGTTCGYDGFVTVTLGATTSSGVKAVYVNDIQINAVDTSGRVQISFMVNKGDVVTYSGPGDTGVISDGTKVAYYKLRDYSDR